MDCVRATFQSHSSLLDQCCGSSYSCNSFSLFNQMSIIWSSGHAVKPLDERKSPCHRCLSISNHSIRSSCALDCHQWLPRQDGRVGSTPQQVLGPGRCRCCSNGCRPRYFSQRWFRRLGRIGRVVLLLCHDALVHSPEAMALSISIPSPAG